MNDVYLIDRNNIFGWLLFPSAKLSRYGFLTVVLALLLTGCAAPVGVRHAGLRDTHLEITSSALSTPELSSNTNVILHRYNLLEQVKIDPVSVLLALHGKAAGEDDRRDLRFALAELCYLHADTLENSDYKHDYVRAPDYFLASAIYAYLFLLGDSREEPPTPYDDRFRQACDLYNRALGKGLATGENGEVSLKDGVRRLPTGQLRLSFDTDALKWDINQFDRFLLADDYLVRGFTIRNRTAGMGAPMVAVKTKEGASARSRVVPLTAFLRIDGGRADLADGTVNGELALYSTYDDHNVIVNGRVIPLETDTTMPIALALDNPDIWSQGLWRFLKVGEQIPPRIVEVQPYERGRIPVVFVHGTASDLVWWAEMLNTLRGDAQLREGCQFWFFRYNSSRPIVDSAAALRKILMEKRREFDPDGVDPAMNQMVVIGHSQGGLLTKLTAVRTGDKLWRALSDTPLDQADIEPEGKELIRELLFVEPLPFVKRVVFISTPHRGSFLAKNWVVNLFRRFISLPENMIKGATALLKSSERLKLPFQLAGRLPTSLDSMSPGNPVLQVLADIPLASGVTAHSIIAIDGDEMPPEGDDGVVEYTSAHLEGVASEFIVRSGHSCQQHPSTIEEVRRILLEHLASRTFRTRPARVQDADETIVFDELFP